MIIRNILAAMLALMLICGTACAENATDSLYQTLGSLLEAEDNVTLKGEAAFTIDDQSFKKLSVQYLRKNSKDHYLNVDFWTRGNRHNGEDMEYTSGYAVLAENGMANAWDKYNRRLEHDISYAARKTLIGEGMRLYDRLGDVLPELAKGIAKDYVTPVTEGAETIYHVKADGSELPKLVQNVAETALSDFLYEYLEVLLPEEGDSDPYHSVEYNFNDIFSALYEKNYGEKPAKGFMDRMYNLGDGTDEEWERYGTVYGQYVTMVGKAHQQYKEGYSYLNADGTLDHYDAYYQFLQGTGTCYVNYEDFEGTAEQFIADALKAGTITEEDKKGKSIYTLAADLKMQEHFEEIGRKANAVTLFVREDGSIAFYADEESYYLDMSESVTECIEDTMKSMSIGAIDVMITVNDGRITSAEGVVELRMKAMDDTEHSIKMNFSGTVSDYGTTGLDEAKKEFDAMTSRD